MKHIIRTGPIIPRKIGHAWTDAGARKLNFIWHRILEASKTYARNLVLLIKTYLVV